MPEYFKIIDGEQISLMRSKCQVEIGYLEDLAKAVNKVIDCIDVGNMPRQINNRFISLVTGKHEDVFLSIDKDDDGKKFLSVMPRPLARSSRVCCVDINHGWLNMQVDLKKEIDLIDQERRVLQQEQAMLEEKVTVYNQHLEALHALAGSFNSRFVRSQFSIFKHLRFSNG